MPIPFFIALTATKTAGSAIGWYIAEAVGSALAGVGGYYYRKEISNTISSLFSWFRSGTAEQIKIIETTNNEITRRQQQSITLANKAYETSLNNTQEVLNQTHNQQQYLTSSVHQLNQSTTNIEDATAKLCRIQAALQLIANDANHNMQSITAELNDIIQILQESLHSLSGTHKQVTETNNNVTTTDQELAVVTQQLIQTIEMQQSTDVASTLTIENNRLQIQLNELSAKNEILTSMVSKLSQRLMNVIEENKTLRAENKLPSELKPEPYNENTYNPSLFNALKK